MASGAPSGCLAAVRAQAAAEPEAAWVRLSGWDGPDTAPVTAADLDALDLGRPVVLAHVGLQRA